MMYPTGRKKGKSFTVYLGTFAELIKGRIKYFTQELIAMIYLIWLYKNRHSNTKFYAEEIIQKAYVLFIKKIIKWRQQIFIIQSILMARFCDQ